MRHFIAYHNAEERGSSVHIPYPRVVTRKKVEGLEGVTVWVIAGEGKTPKSYYLAERFIADACRSNAHPGEALPNEISGKGSLFKLSKPIRGAKLIKLIKTDSNNFRNGFYETHNSRLIADLSAL